MDDRTPPVRQSRIWALNRPEWAFFVFGFLGTYACMCMCGVRACVSLSVQGRVCVGGYEDVHAYA